MAQGVNTNFRNHISTTDNEGGRSWVYLNKPSGSLHKKRLLVSTILLLIFFISPFAKVNNEPFFLLNFFERKFILFGQIFWPQDFHLFVIAMITAIIAIILFTVIYGRIWCGWMCPQTIFMEMVFRKIEFWIDGNASAQKRLREGPLNLEKVWKRTLKISIFIFISLLISHTTLSYIVGIDKMKELVYAGPTAHPKGFIAMGVFSFLIFGVFSWFREQACTIVCPYGRLQSVLLDTNSLVVSYDYKRGEPKGSFRKGEDRKSVGKGNCVSCNSCVMVCPTGIDIRNGTQMECINCTACIDACNKVMSRIGLPKGLIRITSENRIIDGSKFKVTPRIIAYSIVLFILLSSLTLTFSLRSDFESTILRAPGTLFQRTDGGYISNLYTFKTINKSRQDLELTFKLISHEGKLQVIGNNLTLPGQGDLPGAILLEIAEKDLEPSKTDIVFGIYANDRLIEKKKSTFIGP